MTAAGGHQRLPLTLTLRWAALLGFILAARYPLQWLAASVSSQYESSAVLATPAAPLADLEQWGDAGPAAAVGYLTPHSHCTVLPDGRVEAPPDRASSLPFLFDTTSMPASKTACDGCNASLHGVHCCGACIFGDRLCSVGYPGRNTSADTAQLLLRSGFRLQDLTPCELFARIRGRTLWFAGDSHTWGMFAAAECFLREFAPSPVRRPALRDPADSLALRLLPHVSAPACLELVHSTRVCGMRVDTAAALHTKVLSRLMRLVDNFTRDILVINFGVHYSPFSDFKGSSEPIKQTYTRELAELAAWRQAHAQQLPRIVWTDTGPQHFSTPLGLYPGPQAPKPHRCRPLEAWYRAVPEVVAGSWRNVVAAPLVPRLADAHLRIYNASVPLWESHLPGECSHWCHPAAYELWVFLLNDVLRDSGLGNLVDVQRAKERPAAEALGHAPDRARVSEATFGSRTTDAALAAAAAASHAASGAAAAAEAAAASR